MITDIFIMVSIFEAAKNRKFIATQISFEFKITKAFVMLLNNEWNVQVSDTTKVNSSNADCLIATLSL